MEIRKVMALMYSMELKGLPCDWLEYSKRNKDYVDTLPKTDRDFIKFNWKKVRQGTTVEQRKQAFMLESNRKLKEHYSWKNLPARVYRKVKGYVTKKR